MGHHICESVFGGARWRGRRLSAAVVLAVVASLTAVSAAPAGPSPPVNEAPPVISPPYPVFGTTLTATPGTWSGEDTTSQVSYAWERYTAVGWRPIAGATGASYTVTPADQGGLVVRVTVTADSGAVSTTADSAAVAVIGPYPPAVQSRPVVSGQGVEGGIVTGDPPEATLVVSTGTWSQYPYAPLAGSLSFSYQWLRARNGPWTSIPGATAASYTIQPADWGYSLSATVTATDLIGASSAPSQNSVGVQPPTVTDVGSPFQSYIAGDPYLIRTPASGYCFGSTCVEEPVSTLLRSNGFTQRLTVKRRSKMLIQWIVQRGRREITLGSESAVFPRPGRYRCRFVLTRRGRALLRSADTLSFTVVGWLAYRQGPNDDVTSSQSRASVTPEHQIAISPVPEAWDGPAPKTF